MFDQETGQRRGALGALSSAGRIPFANIVVAAVAGWQLYRYVRARYWRRGGEGEAAGGGRPSYPYRTQVTQVQQQAQQQQAATPEAVSGAACCALPCPAWPPLLRAGGARCRPPCCRARTRPLRCSRRPSDPRPRRRPLPQQAVAHALHHALPRPGGASLAQRRAQEHKRGVRRAAGGSAKAAAAQPGEGVRQRRQGILERWDYGVKQQASAALAAQQVQQGQQQGQQEEEQAQPGKGRPARQQRRRRQQQQGGEGEGLARGFLLQGGGAAGAAAAAPAGGPGQRGVRAAAGPVQHAGEAAGTDAAAESAAAAEVLAAAGAK